MSTPSKTRLVIVALAAVLLTACGGGGGTNAVVIDPTPVVISSTTIVGTAATGAALASAQVVVTNLAGTSPCVETSITTSGVGSYVCTLRSGEIAPFFIVVTDPTGNTTPLVSIATATPTAGTPLTVNATPLTTAIVAQLNNGDALGVVADKTKYNAATLSAIKSNVLNQLAAVLNGIGAPSNYDPFTTNITAASSTQVGNTADQVLDVIKITKTATNALAFSTISDSAPVQMATAVSTGSSVPATTSSVSDLSQAAVLSAQAFNKCFAFSVSDRVTVVNGAITAVATDCQSIVTSENSPSGAPAFKHNGYSANQVFYKLLNSDAMTGAKFSVPEIISVYPASNLSIREKAVLNIRYIDNQGAPSNYITVAQNFPNSSTASRPSNWWITGNQGNYDISIMSEIRKVKDWLRGDGDTYQSGFNFSIYADSSAPLASTFNIVLVTGRGLPSTGLWLVRSVSGFKYSFVVAASRAATPQLLSALTQTCNDCDGFWMSRTAGLSGTAASTLRSNPDSYVWAKSSEGAYDGTVTSNRPVKGDVYTFKLFNDLNLVATEYRVLLDDMTSATNMQYLQWHGIGPNTAAAFDTTNDASARRTSVTLDWIINPNAEPIFDYWFSRTDGNAGTSTKIGSGAASVVAIPGGVSNQFTSLKETLSYNTLPLDGFRNIGFQYRTTNATKKVMVNYYFP